MSANQVLRDLRGRRVIVVTLRGTYSGILELVDGHMNIVLRDAALLDDSSRQAVAKVGTVVVRGSAVVSIEAEEK